MTSFPVLRTPRIVLRLAGEADIGAVIAHYTANERHLAPTNPALPADFLTVDYWSKFVPRARDEFLKDQSVRFFLFDRADEEKGVATVLGTANLTQIVRAAFQACYLGYGLGEKYEGKGLMTEALRALIQYAFAEKNLHRIMANYMPRNTRSGAVLARLGFTIEGTAKEYLMIAGAWEDHVLTSLTNPSWRNG